MDTEPPRATNAHRRATLVFAAFGALTLLAYIVCWLLPLHLNRFDTFDGSALYIGTIFHYTPSGFAAFVLATAVPFLLYLAALWTLPRVPLQRALLIIVAVLVAAPLLLTVAYPAFAADVFGYLMYGRIFSEHGANPFVQTAQHFPQDVYFPPVAGDWRDYRVPYGPLWVLICAGITWIAGDNTLLALVLLKLLVVYAHLACAWLVFLLARDITGSERKAAWALLAYGWNPLLITHFALDGHNDAFMLLFVLAGIWFVRRRRPELAYPALAAGVLVKFVPFLLGPVFLLATWRQKGKTAIGMTLGAALAVICYAPFWVGRATFEPITEQADLHTSSPLTLINLYTDSGLVRPLMIGLFLAGYALVLWRWKALPTRSYGVFVLYLVFLSAWTKGWYLTWLVGLGPLVGPAAFAAAAFASLGVFLQNMTAWSWETNLFGWTVNYGVLLWEWLLTGTLYLPLLLVGVWTLIRRWRAGARLSARE